jgi:excisionase family DNA binding protein
MNAEETADYLRLPRGVKRVYELVADGTLTRHGTRGHLLLLREEVEALARGTG